MVHKLKYLGANKNNLSLRVYEHDVISTVQDGVYYDNMTLGNKFHKQDMKHTCSMNKYFSKHIVKFYKNMQKYRKVYKNIESADLSEAYQAHMFWNSLPPNMREELEPSYADPKTNLGKKLD